MLEKQFATSGGYRWLDAWVLANVIQLGTQKFCRKFLGHQNDPCGRQFDQMTQAARSGVANIAEGYGRRATSFCNTPSSRDGSMRTIPPLSPAPRSLCLAGRL